MCNLLGSVAEYTKHSNKMIVKHNPLNNLTLDPKSDQHLIPLYSIIPESPIKVTRIKEIIKTTKEALDGSTNSPCQLIRKGIENTMENMHTNVRV